MIKMGEDWKKHLDSIKRIGRKIKIREFNSRLKYILHPYTKPAWIKAGIIKE
jgi:hypothetical protein